MFRHFKTLKEAREHIKEKDPFGHIGLVIGRKKSKGAKPYKVGTRLSFLHFA